jgi:large subunit ribosomal protein L23
MAIFGSSKKAPAAKAPAKKAVKAVKAPKADKAEAAPAKAKVSAPVVHVKNVIRRPRLTEKAAALSTMNVYTFDVVAGASKHDIVRAVKALYKVTPVRVNVVNVKGKKVALKSRRGFGYKNDIRKAYIYLKKGDTIDFAA